MNVVVLQIGGLSCSCYSVCMGNHAQLAIYKHASNFLKSQKKIARVHNYFLISGNVLPYC